MSEESRENWTFVLWFLSALVLVALFISAAAQGELTTGHLVLAFTILALPIIGTPLLLRTKYSETQEEKTKRQRIDHLLRDMSDEELIELKQRLSDGDLRDETIEQVLGDDGELVRRR